MRDAPEQKAVRRFPFREHRQGGLEKRRHQFRRLLCLRRFLVHRLGARNRQTLAMRVGVRERAFESFAAEDHHEPMPLPGLDDDLGVAHVSNLL